MTEFLGLNIFDIVVIGLILLLSIKGLLNGFTKELFGAIGLIGGIFVASYFHKTVAKYIYNNITDSISINALNLLSLVLIFALFLIVIIYIGKGVALIGDNENISVTSRLGGMLIKIIKLFFIFALIVFAFSTKPQVAERFKDTLNHSKLYPLLKNAGATILNMPIISNVNLGKKVSTENNNTGNKAIESNNTNIQENNNTSEKVIKKTEASKTKNKKQKVQESNSTKTITTETNKTETNNTKVESKKTETQENNATNSTSIKKENNSSDTDTNSTIN